MSWWEFRGFWGILQRSQKGLNLLLQRPQECHPCLIAAALNIRGRLKNRCAGFQTTFLLKTFIAETSQLLKNQL